MLVDNGIVPSSWEWTVEGGEPFTSWTADDNHASYTALGVGSGIEYIFHFKEPMPNGTKAIVKCRARLLASNGTMHPVGLDINVIGKCSVLRPESATIGVEIGTPTPRPTDGPYRYVTLLRLPANSGMAFKGQVTTPSDFESTYTDSGLWNWTQLITPFDQQKQNEVWNKIALDLGEVENPRYRPVYGVECLDNKYPYGHTSFLADGTEQGSSDTPVEPLPQDLSITAVDLLDSFHCWFMYVPPGDGSIAIPLRSVQWFWEFHATRSLGIWSVTDMLSQWGLGENYPSFPR